MHVKYELFIQYITTPVQQANFFVEPRSRLEGAQRSRGVSLRKPQVVTARESNRAQQHRTALTRRGRPPSGAAPAADERETEREKQKQNMIYPSTSFCYILRSIYVEVCKHMYLDGRIFAKLLSQKKCPKFHNKHSSPAVRTEKADAKLKT